MAKNEKFEDLICWQESRKLVVEMVKVFEQEALVKKYEFKQQAIKCAVSIMNNIAEGFCRFHRKEFIRFLDIAQSSAGELKSMTYIFIDLNYLSKKEMEDLQIKIDSIRIKINALIKYLNKPQKHSNTIKL